MSNRRFNFQDLLLEREKNRIRDSRNSQPDIKEVHRQGQEDDFEVARRIEDDKSPEQKKLEAEINNLEQTIIFSKMLLERQLIDRDSARLIREEGEEVEEESAVDKLDFEARKCLLTLSNNKLKRARLQLQELLYAQMSAQSAPVDHFEHDPVIMQTLDQPEVPVIMQTLGQPEVPAWTNKQSSAPYSHPHPHPAFLSSNPDRASAASMMPVRASIPPQELLVAVGASASEREKNRKRQRELEDELGVEFKEKFKQKYLKYKKKYMNLKNKYNLAK